MITEEQYKQYKQRLIKLTEKQAMRDRGEDPDAEAAKVEKAKLAWEEYKTYVKEEIGIRVPFGSIENAAAAFASALGDAYSAGDIKPERFLKLLEQLLPNIKNDDLGKAMRNALSTPRATPRSGRNVPPKSLMLHAELIAYSIILKRPDLLKSNQSGPSLPKLASYVYRCLTLAGAPALHFPEQEKTVLGWLKKSSNRSGWTQLFESNRSK